MALAVLNGQLYNNSDPWVDYYILNDELTQVYKLTNTGTIQLETSTELENNPALEEENGLGGVYFLAVKNGNLYLDSGSLPPVDDCPDLCDMITETQNKVNLLQVQLFEIIEILNELKTSEQTQTEIIRTSNGWKILS